MWSFQKTDLSNFLQKIVLYKNDFPLSYRDVITSWLEQPKFRTFYCSILQSSPFDAFFWEHPPVTTVTINQDYEFVLVDSPQLAQVSADPNPFRDKFDSNSSVVAFENLGRDAELIVPCPVTSQHSYAHFASFIRNAPENQKHDLFIKLASSLTDRIREEPTWVSTSGLGVYWLHLRLDTKPKYYSYQPYKRSKYIKETGT